MAYKKGHKYHPPKAKAMLKRHLIVELDDIPASIYKEWHMAIASGHSPYLDTDEDGQLCVMIEDQGMMPTPSERTASINWLADRRFGQAPQVQHIETIIRGGSNAPILDVGAFTPAKLAAIKQLLLGPAPGPDQREPRSQDGVIDAEWSEVPASEPAAPAASNQGMSESEPAASADE